MLLGLLIAVSIVGIVATFIIWIVSQLNLGLKVNGFGGAVLVAVIIALVAGVTTMLINLAGITDGQGLVGGIVHLILSAIILVVGARIYPGLKINGFIGVLIASVAIGVFYWLGGQLLGLAAG
jgi:uncharacterized membrane protein YvlD (DUF360 family)